MATAALWLLNKLYLAKPTWQKYEGAVISGVKFAEKEIPDDTPNKGLARLDAALRYAIGVYEQAKGRAATRQELADFKNGIQLVHAELEASGAL